MRSGQSYALAGRVMDKIAESVRTIINWLKLFVWGLSSVWGRLRADGGKSQRIASPKKPRTKGYRDDKEVDGAGLGRRRRLHGEPGSRRWVQGESRAGCLLRSQLE